MLKRDSAAYIFDVGEQGFPERVLRLSAERPVMVDFWADWCAPCRALTPVLERVVQGFDGRIALAKVEVDENMRLAGHYKLRGFPTVLVFRDGTVVERFSGYKPEHTVREMVLALLAEGAGER